MSDQAGEKKHPPTQSKLRKLREQGQWYSSRDLPMGITLLVGAILWSSTLPMFSTRAVTLARHAWATERLASVDPFRAMEATIREAAEATALMVALVMIAMFCVTALIQFLQIGPMFSVKPLWRPSVLNPAQGFKQIFFRGQTYKKFALGMIKAVLMLGLAVFTVYNLSANMFLASRIGVDQIVRLFNSAFSTFLYQAALLSLLFGAADYLIQKIQFFEDQKMTDEELKEDTKETEGRPEVKAHIRMIGLRRLRGGGGGGGH
jgi:flagellar biosynthetic protein FlhB